MTNTDQYRAAMLGYLAEKGSSSELEQQLTSQNCWLETQSGTTPLMCAARADGNPQDCHATCAVLLLTEAGGRHDRKRMANAAGADGIGCLHLAAASDNVQVAEKLLQAGAKVNAGDSWGRSPLMFAVARGNGPTAELLLRTGADPLQKDSTGQTPMQLARDLKSDVMEQLMLRWLPTNLIDQDFHEVDTSVRQKLNSGNFSVVSSVQTEPPLPIVVRVLLQNDSVPEHVRTAETKGLSALKLTKHRNIVQFLNHNVSSPGVTEIFLEKVEGRTLEKVLESGPLPKDSARKYAKQIANALSYLHNHPNGAIVHRDIKCDNIMVTEDGVVKLIDFGFALIFSNASVIRTTTKIGCFSHMAPEIILAENCSYSTHSDVWAFGCALYHMAMGEPPFKGHDAHVIVKILSGVPPIDPEKRFDPALQDLYNQCMQKEPQDRISAVGIVLHQFCKFVISANSLQERLTSTDELSMANLLSSIRDQVIDKLKTSWKADAEVLIEGLQQVENKIDHAIKDATGAKIAGSAVAVVGGVAAIAGTILTFLTVGVALPVMIAGTAVAVAGGIGSATSEIVDKVLHSKAHEEVVVKMEQFRVTTENIFHGFLTETCNIVRRKILVCSFNTIICGLDFDCVKKILTRLNEAIGEVSIVISSLLNECPENEREFDSLEKFRKRWQNPIVETLEFIESNRQAVEHLDVDWKTSDRFCGELAKNVELFEKMFRVMVFGSADERSDVFFQEIKSGMRLLVSGVHIGVEAVGDVGKAVLPRILGVFGAAVFTVADVGFLIYYSKQMHDIKEGRKDPLAVQVAGHRMRCATQCERLLMLLD